MIVSHEHRFIFVKTRKTAGTSVEVLLSALAGDDAIVTPLGPPEPGHEPRNWKGLFNPVPEVYDRYVRREPSLDDWSIRATFSELRLRRAHWNHHRASVIRARMGRRVWDDYFTFCFERNPWDKVVSWYYHLTRDNPARPAFEKWSSVAGLPTDWCRYTIGGGIAVDFVGRFECLNEDLTHALREVGITDIPQLPRAKSQSRPSAPSAHISEELDRRIRDEFAHEIRHFGYVAPELH